MILIRNLTSYDIGDIMFLKEGFFFEKYDNSLTPTLSEGTRKSKLVTLIEGPVGFKK